MHIAILTFDGFNELDSLIALDVLNRIKRPGWRVTLAAPSATVTSMNGVTVQASASLAKVCEAGAVIYVAPVGEKDAYVARALANIEPCLSSPLPTAARAA